MALEVNMRPAGGFTPDMLNFSQSSDIYQIYADMVAFDEVRHTFNGGKSYCVYAGRKDTNNYKLSMDELEQYAGGHARLFTRMPDALAGTMGNQVAIACYDKLKDVDAFVQTAFELAEPEKPEEKKTEKPAGQKKTAKPRKKAEKKTEKPAESAGSKKPSV